MKYFNNNEGILYHTGMKNIFLYKQQMFTLNICWGFNFHQADNNGKPATGFIHIPMGQHPWELFSNIETAIKLPE